MRQTTLRVDLRNNIVHSNANGDLGVAPFFDRVYFFNGAFSDITAQTTNDHHQRHAELHDRRHGLPVPGLDRTRSAGWRVCLATGGA